MTTLLIIVALCIAIRLINDSRNFANWSWGKTSVTKVTRWHSTAPHRGYKPSRPTEIYPMRDKCELCDREDDNSDEHEVNHITITYKRTLWGTPDFCDPKGAKLCTECQKDNIKLLTSNNEHVRVIGRAIAERTIVTLDC